MRALRMRIVLKRRDIEALLRSQRNLRYNVTLQRMNLRFRVII